MGRLRRKVDTYLEEWKANPHRLPLIVKGARQIGKTDALLYFAKKNYDNVVVINFALQPSYKEIFNDGFDVRSVIDNISFKNPEFKFEEGKTIIFFDELQECPSCATSLKAFSEDGRYDVVCSGSLMGIFYKKIESNSVGYKEDYEMHALDFGEFLWAKGYTDKQIDDLYQHMKDIKPLSDIQMKVMLDTFREYMTVGGMPAVVARFIEQKSYSGLLKLQKQLLLDYEEDITKYAEGLDKTRISNVYRAIPVFLGRDNKKFRITQVSKNARSREYIGTVEWLSEAGIVNVCYCMNEPFLPIKGNLDTDNYKIYYHDIGLLIASLDEEAQLDLRENKNFNAYKGAIYENAVASMLYDEGYELCFYKNKKSTVEIDFFVRDRDSLVPLEVKANDGEPKSMRKYIENEALPDIKYGIKLANKNIGFNGKYYTYPYFLAFLLKRLLASRGIEL